MKIIYICSVCGNEIIRPIKEDEMIMSGKTRCMECMNWIIFFKVEK